MAAILQIPLNIPDGLTWDQLAILCSEEHPNHRCLFQIRGRPHFWTAWCETCEKLGWVNDGLPPPDMSNFYLAQANAWAAKAFALDEDKRTERSRRRANR